MRQRHFKTITERTLAELRDALLPKLLSDELRIENTEALLSAQQKSRIS